MAAFASSAHRVRHNAFNLGRASWDMRAYEPTEWITVQAMSFSKLVHPDSEKEIEKVSFCHIQYIKRRS